MAQLLLVEDDAAIRSALIRTLTERGHAVTSMATAMSALQHLLASPPDLILLDLGLPDISGFEAMRMMRAVSSVPVVVITARDDEADIIRVLDAGADDYVVKPFGAQELLARIRAALRRTSSAEDTPAFLSDELKIDFAKRAVTVKGNAVRLTPKEFELLRHLVAERGTAIGHRRLLQAVWGPDYGEETEYLRVFINQLRKKIEPDPHHPRYIHTEPWVGYRFEPPREKTRSHRSAE